VNRPSTPEPVTAVLDSAARSGVALFLTPTGSIGWRCRGPLPASLKAELVANKPGILAALAAAAPSSANASGNRPNGNKPAFWMRRKTGHVSDPRLDPPHEWLSDPEGVSWCFSGDASWRSLPQNTEVKNEG